MNNKEAANFVSQIVDQLFNHGWAEDYQDFLKYNDHFAIHNLFKIAVDGDGKALNAAIDTSGWDEEYDLKYDDGGLFSFAMEVGKIMRKFKMIEEDKKEEKSTKARKRVEYSFSCPHCDCGTVTNLPEDITECRSCENPIKVSIDE